MLRRSPTRRMRHWFETENLWLFILGVLLLGVLSSAAYDLLTWAPGRWWWRVVLIGLSLVPLVWISIALSRRIRAPELAVDVNRVAPQHRALLVFVGAGHDSTGPIRSAIEHHAQHGELTRCWLVHTDHVGSRSNAESVRQHYATSPFTLIPCLLDEPEDAKSSHDLVLRIIRELDTAPEDGLQVSDLIVDITGGPKPTTAGAVLACIAHDVAMQYIRSERDNEGRPLPRTSVPWKVEYRWDADRREVAEHEH